MNQTVLVVIILLAIAGAVALYVLHRRSSATAKTVSSLGARVDNAATKVENVAAKVAAVPSLVAQHVDAAFKAKARPIVATTAEPVPAPAPAPAAPAASAAVEPPPATVAPAASPAAPAPSAGGGGTVELDIWPQVIEVDGVHLLASAPINPNWKIDDETRAYDSPTSYLGEPSNGGKCKPPQPLRSPAGYPLFYALGAGNAPVGAPRVLYGDTSYPDDAAVAAAIAAKASDDQAHDIAAAAAANQVFAGPVPVSALAKDDLRFLWWANANPATPKLHNWAYTVLSGSRRDIQVALASVSADIAWLRHYDPATYSGVLRSYYDAAVKA